MGAATVPGGAGGPVAEGPVVEGLVVVDKPSGWTSHDVVARSRRILRTRRIGHAGTLDPMATGVLVLGVGRGTRLLGHLALTNKVYEATVRLGVSTTTDDAEGEVLTVADDAVAQAVAADQPRLAAAMAALTGEIDQVPSAVSAVKVDGMRAYARVRAGQDVVLAARRVTVSRFDLLAHRGTDLDVAVACSSGTYVRALARDLGAALGCGAHLTALRRTSVGPFGLAGAVTLDALAERGAAALRPLADAVGTLFPRRQVDADEACAISHGRRLPPFGVPDLYGVFGPAGELLALARDTAGAGRPLVVFTPPSTPGPAEIPIGF
ncbi:MULTISPECIES: tRNA pseudouridine(55) synthase TruB [Protofrankia]|uniref:tRNA pseudouridine synthase B n=1 Tax=Candidatus Protofrankia datiscae TaxID=2716812 RepID=F8B3B3_9ACTN|nr:MULTISPECIES: tRNA pseudouridine(55) synthase TruB [Protofrankia]AEH10915.1 tRNA pseudouridine synthase B [Candidatus Protofrankia datiscae]